MNGDNMNKEDMWQLFMHTGKIEYYLKYKKLTKENNINDKKSRRNNS